MAVISDCKSSIFKLTSEELIFKILRSDKLSISQHVLERKECTQYHYTEWYPAMINVFSILLVLQIYSCVVSESVCISAITETLKGGIKIYTFLYVSVV